MNLERGGFLTAVLLVVLVGIPTIPLQAQDLSVTPYLSGGPDDHGAFSAAAGVRVEVIDRWGGYARFGARATGGDCLDIQPPRCVYPDGGAGEYALGALVSFFSSERWEGRAGIGGGVLAWQDEVDPFFDLSVEVLRTLSARLDLLIGLHGLVAPGIERAGGGSKPVVSKKTAVFRNAVLGLSFRPD